MIQIQVITYNGIVPINPLSAEFDELGGNIGRVEGNTLVLADPRRNISRIHASIVCRGGRYFIRGLGSTLPVHLNDQPLGNGQDTAIVDGDRIRIGDYVMQVRDSDNASSSGLSETESAMHQVPTPSNNHSDNQSLADLLAFPEEDAKQSPIASKVEMSDSIASNSLDPFASHAAATPKQTIPSDFDPFAKPSDEENKLVEIAALSSAKPFDELKPVLEPKEKQPSIDDVINPPDSLVSDAANKRKTSHEVQRDDVPEIKASVPPMHVQEKSVEAAPVFEQKVHAGDSFPDHEKLLQAFFDGAGISNLDKPIELTPQLMNLIGQLLRESTRGTLDLLLARALTKREMHAEMTMIAPRENNPLKLSPNVEAALLHLLFPKSRELGFMPPLQAMKDAYNDLRSHQFGFMAGMRAALSGILERFNPNQLEKRLGQKTLVDSVFSLNRKANLWDMFTDRYSDISREAEEDFHVLFSKEFLRAYEAQIAKLELEDKKKR